MSPRRAAPRVHRPLLAAAAAAALLAGVAARAAEPAAQPAGDPKARAYFTDAPFVTQDGREVRFYGDVLRGKVVVMDFIFTRCTYACPLLTEKLRQVRTALGAEGDRVEFVSVSIDPARDGPADLLRFAKQHGAVHPRWTWLTGKKEDVDVVLKRLGQYVEDVEAHGTIFIAGDVDRRHWIKIRSEQPAAAIAEQLRPLLEGHAGGPSAAR